MAQLITKSSIERLPRTRDINNNDLRDYSIKIHIKLYCNTKLYLIASVEYVREDFIFLCYTIDSADAYNAQWEYISYSNFVDMVRYYGIQLKRDIYFNKCELSEVLFMSRI